MLRRVQYLYLLFLTIFNLLFLQARADNVDQSLIISVVPQLAPVAIHKAWTPVLQKLTEETGISFQLDVPASIPEFEKKLAAGIPDLAFMNPYHMVVVEHLHTYTPLLRDSANLLTGIIIVRKDSGINDLQDLKGKTLAFPAPNAFAASLLLRALLAQKHIDIQPIYVKNHSNVYRSILLNDVSAGGGVNNTFEREPIDVQEQLKILYVSPTWAPHPLAVHQRITPELQHKIMQAFFKLAENRDNDELFNAIQIPKPVAADYSRDYQPLELLDLNKFAVSGSD